MFKKLFNILIFCLLGTWGYAQADLTINPSINSPTSACYMSNSETITIVIVNTSAFPYAGNLEIGYSLNMAPNVIETQNIGFMPGSGTFIYSFPTPDDFSACQIHNLQIWIYDPTDPNNLNDTINVNVTSDCDPTAGWISGADTVCQGNNSGEINLNGWYGNILEWGESTDGGITWTYSAAADTFLTYNNIVTETQYTAVMGSPYGLCPNDTSAIYTLYIDAPSDAGTLTADFDICDNGNGGTVETVGYVGDVLDWETSGDFGVLWSSLNTTNDTIWYSNLTDTTWWQVIVKNGTCPADTAGPVIATLIPGTVAGSITGVPLVCNWQNADSLVATGGNGDVIAWYVSTDSGTTWQPTTQLNDSIFNFANLQTDTWFAAEWQLGACPTEFSAAHYVNVLPVVSQITPDTTINEGDAITLNSCCGTQYLWWPDQFMDDPLTSTPTVDPDTDITYFVQITDINGCLDTAQVTITVNPDLTTLVIPDLFTPNADGFNDEWFINNIDSFTDNELTVFNIYGQIVYESSPYLNTWDGTYNGNKLPDGTYFYLLRLNDPFYPDPFQGVVTITGSE